MKHSIEFNNVFFEYLKILNISSGIKENLLKFMVNFGQSAYTEESFEVLKNLNFEFSTGDRVCIIGKNGAGKSTLLKLITGVYKPSSGHIKVEGKISSLVEIGTGMDAELTGRENIYIVGLISGFSKKEIQKKEKEIVDFADIGEFIDSPVKYYSTGMGVRLMFSIATNITPEILVIDELFAGGDINFIDKATQRIEHIKNTSSIFISVTHDMNYAKQFFNKIIYLKNNKIDYFGDDIEGAINKFTLDNLG
jgi:ABC-type polysaccharide/polyol phosphate transport system ATPase subunit